MASLPISISCGKSFVTITGSASASMSSISVSPITGRGVPPSLHTRRDGQSNDTSISGPLKPGLIQRNICIMAYPFAACADWLVGYSRHPVRSLLAQWLGFRFTKCWHCSPVMVNGILASAMLYFFFVSHSCQQ